MMRAVVKLRDWNVENMVNFNMSKKFSLLGYLVLLWKLTIYDIHDDITEEGTIIIGSTSIYQLHGSHCIDLATHNN